MTPMEALISATRWGGQIMMKKDLGEIREGWLADVLLGRVSNFVQGNPVYDFDENDYVANFAG